jgi:dethiobiotin synthetase
MMASPKSFFITGTDTGIGKTWVSRVLADCFSNRHATTYMKPVQTGCTRSAAGEIRAPDYDFVMCGSAQMNGSYEQHVPYRFEPACSPHLAASFAGIPIDLDHIKECYETIAAGMDTVIVEGAGGVLVPLSDTVYILDLIMYLQLPVLLVTPPRLGTLNHTFLSLRILQECGAHIAGIVFNNAGNESPSPMYADNCRMIRERTRTVPFLELPFGNPDPHSLKEFCDAIEQRS